MLTKCAQGKLAINRVWRAHTHGRPLSSIWCESNFCLILICGLAEPLRFIYLYFYINFYSVRFMFIFVSEPFVWRWREIEKSTDFLIQVSNLNRLDCADTKTGPFDKRALWILCLWAVLVAFATQKKPLTSPSCYMYLIRDTWSQFNRRVFCVFFLLSCCVLLRRLHVRSRVCICALAAVIDVYRLCLYRSIDMDNGANAILWAAERRRRKGVKHEMKV